MNRGQLADYFKGVGVKRLSAVDAEPGRSNQHEVGTTRRMRDEFLGAVGREQFKAIYIWLGEDQDGFTVEGIATHYDARLNNPDRVPEWRLYYPSNPVTDAMQEGDTLFLAKDKNGFLYFIVTPEGSTSEQQLFWLFGLRSQGNFFVSRQFTDNEPELDFAARFILDEIGIEFEEPEADKLDRIIEQFGTSYPRTDKIAEVARHTLPEVRAEDDPDAALTAWLDHETALFYRLERRIVTARLKEGFSNDDGLDADEFLSFSLSVHQRRRSRMGYSLEHHLEAVFRAHDVAYVRNATTENNHRPDFLFPDLAAYRSAPADGNSGLTMLGAKSSCKDRWRQVLAEADKIPRKHLLTLEPGISERQTAQMQASNLQLVVPAPTHHTYSENQKVWLWSLGAFITEVKERERMWK